MNRRLFVICLLVLQVGAPTSTATTAADGHGTQLGEVRQPESSGGFAQQSSNTSAENETNLTAAEVAMLWSMDRDEESDQWAPFANDPPSYLTDYEGIYGTTDIQYRRPPEHATEWNRWTTSQFQAGGTDVSVHPPNSSLQQGNIIKDAYIEIAAITPSTEVRYEEGSRELLAHPEGEIQVVVDYRVQPDANLNPRKRVRYSVDSHNIEHVAMANDFGGEDGDTYLVEQVDDPGHAATIDYDVAGGGSRDIVVRAQIEAEITKTVQEAVPTCEDGGTVEDCASSITTEWENSSTETVTESLTVYDRRENVDIYYASITADQAYARPHPEGGVEYQYENLPQYWATLTLPDGNTIYGPYTYYTRRRPRWDTMTASTTGSGPVGETEVNSTVHPVVTVAVPAENGTMPSPAAEMQDTSITSMSGDTHSAPTLDERLKISHRTGVYTQPDTITIRTNQTRYSEFGQVNATGPVDGLEYRSWHTRPEVRQLDIEVEIINRNRSAETATVGIQLFEQATATPVSANDLPGHVTAVGRRLDMDNSTTLNISTAQTESLTVTYYPGATFESEMMYLKTSTTIRTTAAIPRVNSVFADIFPLAAILLFLWLAYKLIRLALPPGMRTS